MAWISIKPENQGGGRQPKEPVAKLYSTGQFTLSHAAVAAGVPFVAVPRFL